MGLQQIKQESAAEKEKNLARGRVPQEANKGAMLLRVP
jgi:hypothetical protein